MGQASKRRSVAAVLLDNKNIDDDCYATYVTVQSHTWHNNQNRSSCSLEALLLHCISWTFVPFFRFLEFMINFISGVQTLNCFRKRIIYSWRPQLLISLNSDFKEPDAKPVVTTCECATNLKVTHTLYIILRILHLICMYLGLRHIRVYMHVVSPLIRIKIV